jgi:hypothetical protein
MFHFISFVSGDRPSLWSMRRRILKRTVNAVIGARFPSNQVTCPNGILTEDDLADWALVQF